MKKRERATDRGEEAEGKPIGIVGKPYASVLEMVRGTFETGFADDFEDHPKTHALSRILTVARCRKEITQAQVAEKMGCGQAKVSKIERSPDRNLGFGDVGDYLKALDQGMYITLAPARANAADHIRFHLNAIAHHLDGLVKLAGDDPAIGRGVEAFAIEQIRDLLAMVAKSLDQLPDGGPESDSPIRLEVAGERGEFLSDRPTGRVRRPSKKPASP